jgi:hypothetical protein
MHRALVLSTPNILSLNSRIRFLVFGFWFLVFGFWFLVFGFWFLVFGFYNLFGPLKISKSKLHNTGGHINPVSYFYLTHSLLNNGFKDIELAIDKRQGTSIV